MRTIKAAEVRLRAPRQIRTCEAKAAQGPPFHTGTPTMLPCAGGEELGKARVSCGREVDILRVPLSPRNQVVFLFFWFFLGGGGSTSVIRLLQQMQAAKPDGSR